MAVEILMPELGESVHEGTVSRWLKKEGEYVKEDEPVVEIMTDKVNTELPSPASGVLSKILIQEGELVEVFHAMGIIDDGSGEVAAAPTSEPKTTDAKVPAGSPETEELEVAALGDRKWYSPVVRSIAKAHGLTDAQLASISGTGHGGRLTKSDLESYVGGKPAAPKSSAKVQGKSAAPTTIGPDQETVQLTGLRKMIADAMVRSAAVPTVSTVTQVDVTTMVQFRDRNKDAFLEQHGVKLTYTPFFIKAITESLLEYPLVNAALMPDNSIVKTKGVHMGVAVALGAKGDEGLIVPVIRNCDKKGLIEIAKDLDAIAKKARANQLEVADVQGGTFTLTNPGTYGALFGTPMINAPQAGILGTYAIVPTPVVVDGSMLAIRQVMHLVLTYDHRLVDGLLAGRFLASVRDRLQAFDFFK